MAKFLPFRALMPSVERVAQVAAVPYDVVSSDEAAELAEGNPFSFLRVSKPEIELEPGIDLYDAKVYAKAVKNFKRLSENAPLKLDEEPNLYVYSLKMGEHTQVGIAGAASVQDYDAEIIKKHERTRKDKEDDRTRHVIELRSHSGPVFLAYRDDKEVDALVAEVMKTTPLFDFIGPHGVINKLWKAGKELSAKLSAQFDSAVPFFYIADGHHRAASASRAAAYFRSLNPNHSGNEDYNYFLAVAFPSSQLRILPYNRVVKDLNGLSKEDFLKRLEPNFSVGPASSPSPSKPGEICLYLDGKWSLLKPKFDIASLGVIGSLDVSVLQDRVLAPLLGIDDPRTSKRVDFVGGIRGTGELVKLVDSGKCAVAFSMYPTTLDQLMAIADAGEIMPPKSTWFEPKLCDGLLCHNF